MLTSLAMGLNVDLNHTLMELDLAQRKLREAKEVVMKLTENDSISAHSLGPSELVNGPLREDQD